MFAPPPAEILVIAVFFLNFGGVFNCVAYTIIKRKLQAAGKKAKHCCKGPVNMNKKGGSTYIITSDETSPTDIDPAANYSVSSHL